MVDSEETWLEWYITLQLNYNLNHDYFVHVESKSSQVTGKSSEPAKAQPVVSTESPKPGEYEPITKEGMLACHYTNVLVIVHH